MNIIVTQEAKEYIKEKGNIVTIVYVKGVGWGAGPTPDIKTGQPGNPSDYHLIEIEGIDVYVHKKIPNQALEIDLGKFMFMKNLRVKTKNQSL